MRRRNARFALVTGVQPWALPINEGAPAAITAGAAGSSSANAAPVVDTTGVTRLRARRPTASRSIVTSRSPVATRSPARTRGVNPSPSSATVATGEQIGREHVCTPVTNAHLVCQLLLSKKKPTKHNPVTQHEREHYEV